MMKKKPLVLAGAGKTILLMNGTRQKKQCFSPFSWWLDSIFLLFLLGSLYFILLGTRPLFVPDEGRYAEIAREMVTSGDYITPYLNHIKYFEKPVLFYWLEAAAIKIGGLTLWSLRSLPALLALLGCLLTYYAGRTLYDRLTGMIAALLLGTTLLYFIMARMISLDLPVTVFLTACLYAFLLGAREQPGFKRRFYFWLATSAAAFAVLTKGLIGMVFPGMIIFTWIALTQEWRLIKHSYLPSCLLIFLLIATPWHWLIQQRNPEFFYFYFIEQHFLRYTTLDVGHYQPAWFFLPNLLFGFFPWIVFLPAALLTLVPFSVKKWRLQPTELFLFLWALLIFVFFSFSKSKLIPYILPVFPPLSLLTARYLRLSLENKSSVGIKISYISLLLLSSLITAALIMFTHVVQVPDPSTTHLYFYPAALILFIGSGLGCYFSYRHLGKALLITLLTTWLTSLLIMAAVPSIDARSILPFAKQLKPLLTPQDEVVTFNQYYQDLPFYLERRVSILNWRNELSYGVQHQDTKAWMWDDNAFWQRWHSQQRLFVVMDLKRYQELFHLYPNERFFLLAKTLNNALVSNHEPITK